MKILHIANGMVPAIARELSKLGEHYYLDWTAYMEYGPAGQGLLEKEIIRASAEINPDVTFLHIQRAGVISTDLARELKGTVINYTFDVVKPIPQWFYEIGKYCITIFCDEDGVDEFKSKGLNSEFSLCGYDDEVFKQEGIISLNYGDIVFLGNQYHSDQNFPLTKYREEMVEFLKREYDDRFRVFGNGWKYDDGNLMYKEDKEAECYRSCKIGISISHFDDLKRYTSDRIYRIMGCGCFCLAKWYPEIEKDFIDGKHLRVWKTLDELKKLIDFYLNNENERKIIAKAGYEYVSSKFTWKIKIKEIINGTSGSL